MNDLSYRTVYEEVLGRLATKQAVVIDTRFNGGGDLVSDLATFLSGRKFMDYATEERSTGVADPRGTWLENTQLNPDIEIANAYGTVSKGRDQQLEKAVETLLKELK